MITNSIFCFSADDSYRYVLDRLAVISYDGTVRWVPHARLRSFCVLDLAHFPYDEQTCYLDFGSWTYHDESVYINLKTTRFGQQFLYNGREWVITVYHGDKWPLFYDGRMHTSIRFTIQMVRVSLDLLMVNSLCEGRFADF